MAQVVNNPKFATTQSSVCLDGLSKGDRTQLVELVRRFQESERLFRWTFIVGFFCLWPLWAITYLEYTRMRDIKAQIRGFGIDVDQLARQAR